MWARRIPVFAVVCALGALAVTAGPVACIILGAAFFAFVRRATSSEGSPQVTGLTNHLTTILVGVGVLVFLNSIAPDSLALESRLLGSAIVILGFVPFLVWSDRREFPIPLFPAVAGIYVIYFGTPVFLTSQFRALRRPVEQAAIIPTQWMALVALIMLELGYYFSVFRKNERAAHGWRPVPNRTPESILLWLGSLGVVVYLYSSVVRVPVVLAQPVTLLGLLATLVAIELYMRWRGKSLSLPGLLFLAVLVGLRVTFGFSTGAVNEALSALIAIAIAAATLRKRIVWTAVALAVAALVVLQPIKDAYRKTDAYGATSLSQRLSGFVEKTKDYATGVGEFPDAKESFVVRYGFLTTLAIVMKDTPSKIPYWNGETYKPLLSKLFPRFLLPWKPQELTGQTFGHRYHLISTYNTRTSYNMPIPVELYANFGRVGMIVGMFLLGVFYAWAQRMSMRRIQPVFGSGFAIFLVAQLAYIESALSFVVSGFFYAVVLVYLVGFGVRVLRSPAPPAETGAEAGSVPESAPRPRPAPV